MPKMIVPDDLGIPLDLLDMSVYKYELNTNHMFSELDPSL
jgi:hypothetical protein